MSDANKERLGSLLLADVTKYYTNFFNSSQANLDETLRRYAELDEFPRGENDDIDIERTDLYSKIKILAEGRTFFESIGIPTDKLEEVCDKTQDFLKSLEQKKEEASRPEFEATKSKTDREVLSVMFEESGITDKDELRKLYESLENFEVSPEDLEAVLESFSSNGDTPKTMPSSDAKKFDVQSIGKATINSPTQDKIDAQSVEEAVQAREENMRND